MCVGTDKECCTTLLCERRSEWSGPPRSEDPSQSTSSCHLPLSPSYCFLFLYVAYFAITSPLRYVPGPFLARFTQLWYLWRVHNGHFEQGNIDLHHKYGKEKTPSHKKISMLTWQAQFPLWAQSIQYRLTPQPQSPSTATAPTSSSQPGTPAGAFQANPTSSPPCSGVPHTPDHLFHILARDIRTLR